MPSAFEGELIRQCAPTLAGLKTANLFMYTFTSYSEHLQILHQVNKIFSAKGLAAEVLRYDILKHRVLLFVYRKSGVENILQDSAVQAFLKQRGFSSQTDLLDILDELAARLNSGAEFPHEIGLLLGYPLADVKAYIQSPHSPGLCSGCWKAYSNPQQAKKYFAKCRCCVNAYLESYLRGRSLEQLALAV